MDEFMELMELYGEIINIFEKIDFDSEFINRFVVYNMQFKWNNQF